MDAFHDLRPVPIDVILSWPKPNYVNPLRRGPALLIVNGILLPIAVAVVIARLYTRLRVVRSAGLDDLFIGLALIPTIGLAICVCLAVTKYSWDIHIWDVPPKHVVPSRKISFATQFLFMWASSLVKLSILSFYRRMSTAVSRKSFSRVVWITITFVVCFHFSVVISLVASCTWVSPSPLAEGPSADNARPYSPVRSSWDITIPDHHCFNQRAFKMSSTVINTLTDFVIILIPLPTVPSGLIRTYYAHIIVNVTYDVTWVGFTMWVYIAVEVDVAMICASAPALKPLFKYYIDPSSRGSKYYHGGRSRDSETGNGVRKGVRPLCQGTSQMTDMRELESEECIIVLQRPSSAIVRGDVFK
ncbi:MAG: hypothetical protein M1839_009449 [Geoglossum umbratile]|nr:MAG: hypothetical protein M1839_009449 [Geoglossum umbratile]